MSERHFPIGIKSACMTLSLVLYCLYFPCIGRSEEAGKMESKTVKNPFLARMVNCRQLILVATPSWPGTRGLLQRYERDSAQKDWQEVGDPAFIVVGKNGLAWGSGLNKIPTDAKFIKKEGDGCAPVGIFSLGTAFGLLPQSDISSLYPYLQLTSVLECIDDSSSAFYNQIVNSSQTQKDWKSSEKMAEFTSAYHLGIVVEQNANPVKKGKGSCIFLHCWKDSSSPTSGCTAMSEEIVKELLAWLDRSKNPLLAQLPQLELYRFQAEWNLPSQSVRVLDHYNSDLVDISAIDPTVHIEAVYSTPNHFLKKAFYAQNKLFLQRKAANRLKLVQDKLRSQGLSLKIWDAYRPWSISKEMWELVKDNRYVADPAYGSKHNRGCAVDLTLVDEQGHELQMPTPYLDFSGKAHRSYNNLPSKVLANRQLLEDAMTRQGFEPYEEEWWHFNDPDWPEYPVLDIDVYKE